MPPNALWAVRRSSQKFLSQMTCLPKRNSTNLCIILFACIIITNATLGDGRIRSQSQQLAPRQIPHGDLSDSAHTEILTYHAFDIRTKISENQLEKRQRLNAQQIWTRLRIGTLQIVWNIRRISALTNPDPSPPGEFVQSLKNLYMQIRQSAINEWAKLPEQNYVRIVCGKIIFALLPPADRTVPWTMVEEIAYSLALMVSAGLGGLVTGTYVPIATSVAFYYYLQVIEPVPEG